MRSNDSTMWVNLLMSLARTSTVLLLVKARGKFGGACVGAKRCERERERERERESERERERRNDSQTQRVDAYEWIIT
jgi:hypothetical protein